MSPREPGVSTRAPAAGYFSLLLHAHLPYVHHPEQERFLEESWFFEAVTETYLPLLLMFEQMADEGVEYRVTWSLTPPLLSMFQEERLQERAARHLDGLVELAEKEVARHRHNPAFRSTAEFYLQRFGLLREYYSSRCQRDLCTAFRRFQDRGLFEILTSAATHGFLPLIRHEPSSVRAQIRVAADHYQAVFGRRPQGIWLPECGYYPGLDDELADADLRYFCMESHGVLHGSTRPRYGVHAPVICPSGVAAFARDPECSKQVWSKEEGFPGDPDYREFYRDIGYDLPLEYVAPYVGPDGVRIQTGIKYHRITGRTEDKEPYVRERALERAAEHAALFLEWRRRQIEYLGGRMDRKPIVLAPYDAELFGHWWFEGPEWIAYLLRDMALDHDRVLAVTPSEYLAEYPDGQLSTPSASSWGHEGYSEVWINGANDWLWPRLHAASAAMTDLAYRHRGARGRRRRTLNQAARELLLAQASDWAFILKSGTATGYATRRPVEHLENFQRLASLVDNGRDSAGDRFLAELETRHRIFPDLSFEVFDDRLPRPPTALVRFPRHVAFLAAEAAPLVKVGGLADVVGALPSALADGGIRVTVLIPAYGVIDRDANGIRPIQDGLAVRLGDVTVPYGLLEARTPGGRRLPDSVRVILVDSERYFQRDGVYVDPATRAEYPDTAERFAFFTRAALESLRHFGEAVDVVHSHDHQTALAPAYLKVHYRDDPLLGRAASVYTLHNLGYQGVYGPETLRLTGFGYDQFYPGSPFEHFGQVNWMKIGIVYADKVTTVSSTYAREICENAVQGAGLAGVLRERRRDLVGILNGIDTTEWNPASDPHIRKPFDVADPAGKRACKKDLLKRAGLDPRALDAPLIALITRLVDQKGLDLVAAGLGDILGAGARVVVLGTGLPKYEEILSSAARDNPGSVAALLRFDNEMAHAIEAGADMFLMPSLYEPCGLNQMYSLRYGTIPIVRATGGLADTVEDADSSPDGVGFTFQAYTVQAMLDAVVRALKAYRDPERWRRIQQTAMARNHSWSVSAERYTILYQTAWAERR